MAFSKMDRSERLLWLVFAAIAIGWATLPFFTDKNSEPSSRTAVFMPVYTHDYLATDPSLEWMGLQVKPGQTDQIPEGHGFGLMEGLSGTAYFGPTLGPEEVALGLLLLEKESGLALLPNQKQIIFIHAKMLQENLEQVMQLAGKSAELSDGITCKTMELVASLPAETYVDFPDNPGCPASDNGEVDLWKAVQAGLDKL